MSRWPIPGTIRFGILRRRSNYGPGGDDRVRFWEVGGLVGFEGYLNGAMQRVDISVGYRTYGEAYSASEGLVVGVVGRFTRPGVFAEDDAFTMQPWFRWADLGEPEDKDDYIALGHGAPRGLDHRSGDEARLFQARRAVAYSGRDDG